MPRKATNTEEYNEFYAEYNLKPLQIQAVELLILSGKTQNEVAETLGIHRNTVSAWVHNKNFVAAMQKCENERNRQTIRSIRSKSPVALDRLWKMAESTNDKRVAKEIYMYIIDRDLGKITAKVEIEDNRQSNTDFDIESELAKMEDEDNPVLSLVSFEKTG